MSPLMRAHEYVFTEDTQTYMVNTESNLNIFCKNKLMSPHEGEHVVDEGRGEHVETPLCDAHSSPTNVLLTSSVSPLHCEFLNLKSMPNTNNTLTNNH